MRGLVFWRNWCFISGEVNLKISIRVKGQINAFVAYGGWVPRNMGRGGGGAGWNC